MFAGVVTVLEVRETETGRKVGRCMCARGGRGGAAKVTDWL